MPDEETFDWETAARNVQRVGLRDNDKTRAIVAQLFSWTLGEWVNPEWTHKLLRELADQIRDI